jgi:hypothetical protein
MKCGAKTRSGEPCKTNGLPNGRCRLHGGLSLSGAASATFKHGLYSKSLPERLASRYEEALGDGQLLELRREAALLTAITDEQIAKLDTGETGAHWARLQDGWADYEKAGDKDREHKLWLVGRLIEDGAREAEAVRELRSTILDKARIAESERKRLVEAHQVITVERLMALVGAISAAVIEEVPDRERRAAILSRFERLLAAPGDAIPA